MAVEQLHVSGYRSIRDLHLELGSLTVIVGPNGCGKTNLYRSMLLVAAAPTGASRELTLVTELDLEEAGFGEEIVAAVKALTREKKPVKERYHEEFLGGNRCFL